MARIHTVFGNRLGPGVPVFGFSRSAAMPPALSCAGGIGVCGLAHEPPDQVGPRREAVRALATDVPSVADIMMPKGMPEDQRLRLAQAGPDMAWTRAPRPVKDVVDVLTAQTLAAREAAVSIAQQR